MDETLIAINTAFAKAVTDITVNGVMSKVQQIKATKDQNQQIAEYNQLINNLLTNRNDLENISQQYKEKIERLIISDEDIEKLHNTIKTVLNLIYTFQDTDEESESVDALLKLLNSDTLRTLQLLGFNYKKAIGDPLTEVTSKFITGHLSFNTNSD